MTIMHFTLSAICIGAANTCIEWFIIGFLFHKWQALTPQTWRPESGKSYMLSTLLSLLFGVFFTFFYFKIGAHYVLVGNLWSHIKLGIICFACFGFILEAGNAIYINYNKKFMLGKMIASCLSYVAAAVIASFFYWR